MVPDMPINLPNLEQHMGTLQSILEGARIHWYNAFGRHEATRGLVTLAANVLAYVACKSKDPAAAMKLMHAMAVDSAVVNLKRGNHGLTPAEAQAAVAKLEALGARDPSVRLN